MAVMLWALFGSCNSDSGDDMVIDMLSEIHPIALTEDQRAIRDNNNEFACRLFRAVEEMKQEKEKSTILSPLSVTYMLGMLNAGADGVTRQQITDVLGLGSSVQGINEYCKKMIEEAPKVDKGVTVKIGNSIFVNSAMGINLLKQYSNDMNTYYHAEIDALDFTKNNSLDIINKWCKKSTDGMIPSVLDKLDAQAAMYLLNAIYFKATWTEKFDPNDTRDMDFTKGDGTIVNRQLMHRKAVAMCCQDDVCSLLSLPYGSCGYIMFVLLPNEGKTITDVINKLSSQYLTQLMDNEHAREVDILMPRFTTSSDIGLVDVLSSMGMPQAFDEVNAEFPNMAERNSHSYNMFVKAIKQVAKIEVDEQGTKAAAVTVTKMYGAMDPGPQQYEKDEFHATRPFVYLITEGSTHSIFFMGTYRGD